MNEPQQYRTIDKFDRMMGALVNLPDVTHTKPSTVQVVSPIIGEAQTFIIRTFRQRDRGDTIFVEYAAAGEHVRLYFPPEVAEAIARQRDALTAKVRKRVGKESAEARKARGELPAFLKGRNGKGG